MLFSNSSWFRRMPKNYSHAHLLRTQPGLLSEVEPTHKAESPWTHHPWTYLQFPLLSRSRKQESNLEVNQAIHFSSKWVEWNLTQWRVRVGSGGSRSRTPNISSNNQEVGDLMRSTRWSSLKHWLGITGESKRSFLSCNQRNTTNYSNITRIRPKNLRSTNQVKFSPSSMLTRKDWSTKWWPRFRKATLFLRKTTESRAATKGPVRNFGCLTTSLQLASLKLIYCFDKFINVIWIVYIKTVSTWRP